MTVRELIKKLENLPSEQLDWETEVSTDCESEGAHFSRVRDIWSADASREVVIDGSEEI